MIDIVYLRCSGRKGCAYLLRGTAASYAAIDEIAEKIASEKLPVGPSLVILLFEETVKIKRPSVRLVGDMLTLVINGDMVCRNLGGALSLHNPSPTTWIAPLDVRTVHPVLLGGEVIHLQSGSKSVNSPSYG